jgi:Holliday junction resolvase RusA-like endonuclease
MEEVDGSKEIRFWVAGDPQPGGSKRGFYNAKLGRVIITEDNKRCAPWRAVVSEAAQQATTAPFDGPLHVRFEFHKVRPKSHFGTGKYAGALKPSAPPYPTVKPDTTKLVRAAEDALKGICWRDDSQVVSQRASKRYGSQAGMLIVITPYKT